MKIINAKYVSVWDGGIEVKSHCTFDIVNYVVSDVEVCDVNNLDILDDEYVLLPNGIEIRDFTIEK